MFGSVDPTLILVALINGAISLFILHQTRVNQGISRETQSIANEVKRATNGMKDQLVAVSRSDAMQMGVTQGIADQKATQAELDAKDSRSIS